ncbi:MAG TPA: ABC transporter ATP-binding protein [Solirubrobacteraceae bacterium]|nr:ABC transporter ATP-binding protein [Solirubrobacteraceae bacterium]
MDSREVPAAAGLAVREVSVSFGGITALEDVSVEVAGGEVVGVIGPNGAGKTTLFNVICGFVAPDSGTITWRDGSMDRLRPHRLSSMGISRTLQGVGLFSKLTVLENVMTGADRFRRARYGGALLGMWTSDRDERALRDRARASLSKLDCAGIEDRLPGTLPFAVQKRVALARALACDPELLLLDEPAGGLATDEMSELGELIRTLGKSIAVMVVEHHMDLVMSVCDRVVVLDFGRVIAAGEPAAIRENPRVLEAYLGRDAGEQNVAAAGTTDADG